MLPTAVLARHSSILPSISVIRSPYVGLFAVNSESLGLGSNYLGCVTWKEFVIYNMHRLCSAALSTDRPTIMTTTAYLTAIYICIINEVNEHCKIGIEWRNSAMRWRAGLHHFVSWDRALTLTDRRPSTAPAMTTHLFTSPAPPTYIVRWLTRISRQQLPLRNATFGADETLNDRKRSGQKSA